MLDLIIPILVFLAVLTLGGAVAILVFRPRRSMEPRLDERLGNYAGGGLGAERTPGGLLSAVSGLGRVLSLGQVSNRLREQLGRAGYFSDSAPTTYLGTKLLLLIVALAGSAVAVTQADLSVLSKSYLVGLVAAIGFFLPNYIVRSKRNRRTKEIRGYLPDAVDLLEVCVSAGMGLDMAWNSVSDEIRHVSSTLADEMALVNLEVQLGAPRTDAMRNMADRTGAEELSSLVALLVQSERFGTSIADALQTFASSMREFRSLHAEETAEKTAVKLLFPLVLFIFPAMLIVMVGPAGMTLFKVMTGG